MPTVDNFYAPTWREAHKLANAAQRERRIKAREEMKFRKPRVVAIRENGKEVEVMYTSDSGERVVARFVRTGWCWPPREVMDAIFPAELPRPAAEPAE